VKGEAGRPAGRKEAAAVGPARRPGQVRTMQSTSQALQIKLAATAILSFLLLLAFAVGAQAAAAAHFSNGSATTTPAAGTQGRGGVDGASALAAASTGTLAGTQGRGGAFLVAGATTPAAGTAGRGGVSVAAAPTTPPAGTAGRGGVAVLSTPGAAGRSAGAVAFAFSRPRGAFLPVPQAGNVPSAAVAPRPLSSADWAALAIIAAFAAVAGLLLYAASRRRTVRHASALASYCTYHPSDSVCGAA
jgi:hypothetical protein